MGAISSGIRDSGAWRRGIACFDCVMTEWSGENKESYYYKGKRRQAAAKEGGGDGIGWELGSRGLGYESKGAIKATTEETTGREARRRLPNSQDNTPKEERFGVLSRWWHKRRMGGWL
jgi:hypothetical protein